MKKKIIFSLLIALLLVGAMRPAPALAGDIFKFSGVNANAFFFSQEGDCVATFVAVFANEGTSQSPPGPPSKGSFADVFIDRFDFCTETSLISASGFKTLDKSEFSIDQKLNSANLNTSIELFDFVTGTSFTVDVNLNWTGTGDLFRQSFSFKSMTPKCKFMDSSRGTFRSAEAAGVISDGTTNFTPEPTSGASLNNTHSGTLIIGCN